MSDVVILGADLGGVIMAYEMKAKLGKADTLTVVNLGAHYSFVPPNPWVALGWRSQAEISVDLTGVFARRGIAFNAHGQSGSSPRKTASSSTTAARSATIT